MSTVPPTILQDFNLFLETRFIPYSQSRNAKPNPKFDERSLNWEVSLYHTTPNSKPRLILTSPYSAGIGGCPSYSPSFCPSIDYVNDIIYETDTGYCVKNRYQKTKIEPNSITILWSLVLDSDAINYPNFESWADSMGFDSDSRRAESTYKQSLAIGLALRAALGDDALDKLHSMLQDY